MEEQDYATTYRLEGANWWFVGTRRICVEWVGRLRSPSSHGDRILDVGCGTGISMEELGRLGAVVGLDVSATALEFCRQRDLTDLVRAPGERLPFPDDSFDVVTAFDVLEHIRDDEGAIREWVRVLRPGGHLVIFTSAYQLLWSGHDVSNHHVRRYRSPDLERMLAGAGLGDRRVSYVNTVLLPPILLVRLVQRAARRGRPPTPHKDEAEVASPINRLLVALLGFEAWTLRRWNLPAGVSIAASGRKPPRPVGVRSGTSSD